MRKILILLAGASLVFGAAACGDDDDAVASADSYDDFEDEWMEQCTPAAAGAPSGAETVCQCAFDSIKESVPLEDFQAFNEEVNADPSAALPDEIMTAVTDCATEGVTTAP